MRKSVAALLLAIGVLARFTLPGNAAYAGEPMEDVDYVRIEQQPVARDRIEVVEFFYYGCESCNRLEPRLQAWFRELPADVSFRRIPAIRRSAWVSLTRLYFALEQLGELDRLHIQVYRAVHDEGLNLANSAERDPWAVKAGLDAQKLSQAMESEPVLAQVQRAHDATVAYGVRATPTIVVDGTYLTSAAMVGDLDGMLPLIDALVEKARTRRRAR